MKTSIAGLFDIAVSEAIVPAPYLDAVNVWTYGIGHTAPAGPPDPATLPRGMPVGAANMDAAIRRAVRLFQQDITKYEDRVKRFVRVPLAQHEFDALTSFEFNTGGLASSSGTPKLNAGDKTGAWDIFEKWNKGTMAGRKVTLSALVDRRAAERRLFFSGAYAGRSIPVWRVSTSHRPIYRDPVKMLTPRDFRQMLAATATEQPIPMISDSVSPGWFALLLEALFGSPEPRAIVAVPQTLGATPNGLPIYVNAADFPNWRWRNFRPEELACKGTGRLALHPAAMDKLQALRDAIGKPMRINSAYRSPEHNRAVGGAPASKHMLGIAFDVSMAGHDRAAFKRHAERLGFNGIGDYLNFVHIDTRPERARW